MQNSHQTVACLQYRLLPVTVHCRIDKIPGFPIYMREVKGDCLYPHAMQLL